MALIPLSGDPESLIFGPMHPRKSDLAAGDKLSKISQVRPHALHEKKKT
jgi:hypothetical protein